VGKKVVHKDVNILQVLCEELTKMLYLYSLNICRNKCGSFGKKNLV